MFGLAGSSWVLVFTCICCVFGSIIRYLSRSVFLICCHPFHAGMIGINGFLFLSCFLLSIFLQISSGGQLGEDGFAPRKADLFEF